MLNTPYTVTIPLVNTNEPEAILVSLLVENGDYVEKGSVLGVLETTKSTLEIQSEHNGYVSAIQIEERSMVNAGDVFCSIVATREQVKEFVKEYAEDELSQFSANGGDFAGLRISNPALKLLQESALDPASLPRDRFITREMVEQLLQADRPPNNNLTLEGDTVILYGGGGHAKMLIDLIRSAGVYNIAGIIDDGLNTKTRIMGVPVLGTRSILESLKSDGIRLAVNAVGGIGNIKSRIQVFQTLINAGFGLPAVIHPSAVVEDSAVLSQGVQVFAKAYIGGDVKVGFGGIISTGSIVSHDCILEEYAIISPGAVLAGEITIRKKVLIGMGVNINLRVEIGENVRIGNGATILSSVPANQIIQAGTTYR